MQVNLSNVSTKRINVLFVGGGRRNTLAKYFKARGFNVYAYETDLTSPIREEAVIVKGERFDSANFISHLQKCISDNKIQVVIPLMDTAIPLMSGIRQAVCSPYDAAIHCTDKTLFENFMLDNFPTLYPKAERGTKLIQKPRFGCGSKDIKILDPMPVAILPKSNQNFIIQSYKVGKEYTVDAYFDRDCRMVAASPRERIRVAGGEVVDSKTVQHDALYNYTKSIGEALCLRGPVCMQFIISGGKAYLFEINARFGGGSTLSLYAGLDMIDMIKKEYIYRQKLCASEYKVDDNMMVRRVFNDIYWKAK